MTLELSDALQMEGWGSDTATAVCLSIAGMEFAAMKTMQVEVTGSATH